MRIKEQFALERVSEEKKYKPKYFIASEGQKTEPKYFENLNKSVISENVTIINILRDYADLGSSNPTFLIKMFKTFLDNNNDTITVLEIKNKIANFAHENPNKIDVEEVNNRLDKIYKSNLYKIFRTDLENLFITLFKSEIYKDLAENFSLYFLAQDVTYSSTTDCLNMVIDRDKDSFTERQYDEVVQFCKQYGINLYVSNPCFEIWLYLHFKEIEQEDREKLLENPKVNNSRRYIEKRLHDICKYTKNRYSFEKFQNNIKDAIIREKDYEENIEGLKNSLGTNVGLLVAKMIDYKN